MIIIIREHPFIPPYTVPVGPRGGSERSESPGSFREGSSRVFPWIPTFQGFTFVPSMVFSCSQSLVIFIGFRNMSLSLLLLLMLLLLLLLLLLFFFFFIFFFLFPFLVLFQFPFALPFLFLLWLSSLFTVTLSDFRAGVRSARPSTQTKLTT